MAQKLLKTESQKGSRLSKKNERFLLSIETKLENGYEIKDMDKDTVKELHHFVTETIEKKLSISQVDERYLRKKDSDLDDANQKNIIHYGKDGSTFRLFGYYNDKSYFVITRIDGKHKTHKSK